MLSLNKPELFFWLSLKINKKMFTVKKHILLNEFFPVTFRHQNSIMEEGHKYKKCLQKSKVLIQTCRRLREFLNSFFSQFSVFFLSKDI